MANINIFYSWQSDLPGAETRNFIQSCIDAVVKTLRIQCILRLIEIQGGIMEARILQM